RLSDRKPVGPPLAGVPPGAVDPPVGPDREQVEVGGRAGDGGDRVAGREAARLSDRKPVGPPLAGVPPGGLDPPVGPDREQVEVVGRAGDGGDRVVDREAIPHTHLLGFAIDRPYRLRWRASDAPALWIGRVTRDASTNSRTNRQLPQRRTRSGTRPSRHAAPPRRKR